MTMTTQYAEMLRRYAATMDDNLQPAKAEAVRQAARHMEELQSRLDATPEGYGSAKPAAWQHGTDSARVIGASQKAQAERDGGASASSVAPYITPLVAVPAGYALVPLEPTEQMLEAARDLYRSRASLAEIGAAMIAAAATPGDSHGTS